MGASLCLKIGNGDLADAEIIHAYYDYMSEKEHNYRPESTDEGPDADWHRQMSSDIIDDNYDSKTVLCEQWLSNIHDDSVEMNDLFTFDSMFIYDEDIRTFIKRLREGKEYTKRQDDANFWEYYFELRLIALCEFALEHDYGVRLSV